MKILVTGSSGLIGRALVPFFARGGHQVTRLLRTTPSPGEAQARLGGGQVFWNPAAGTVDAAGLEGFDALVHLAGESIVGRWTAEKKARIYESRVKGTQLLSESLSQISKPPKTLACASASGYYGDCADEVVTEDHPPAVVGFLAQVCQEWEAATEPARRRGIRVVNLRTGLVLTSAGGGLASILFPFRMGLGGRLGSGRQFWSWVAIDDVLGAILHILTTEALHGPVNVVAPNPVTNSEFTKILGQVLRRPTLFPVPSFALRMILGSMAEEVLLASSRLVPARLVASGYQFRYSNLEAALRHLLGKPSPA
jgi:hypothetical protein